MKKTLAVAVAAAATSFTLSAPAATAATAATNDFYTPPSSLPSQNGAVIKSEAQKVPFQGTSAKSGIRLMYKSTDQAGQATAVTGTYLEPTKAWSGGGPRPLVVLAPGTQGQGDACAPSKQFDNPLALNEGQLSAGYEIPSAYGLLDKGVAVVVTDYIGLGTPGVHTYVNRVDEAHAVLDAARAAKSLTGTSLSAGSPIGLYGYSQGGGATAAAAELAASYAPELDLKGTYAGAPPADLYDVMVKVDGTSLVGVIGYAINGLLKYYPDLKTILDNEINSTGTKALNTVAEQCVGGSLAQFAFTKTSKWTKSGESAGEIVKRYPEALKAVEDQRIGTIKPKGPVMVLTGTQDDIVSHDQVKKMTTSWCKLGGNVTYKPVIQLLPTFGSGLNHLSPITDSMNTAQPWLIDRLAGKPSVSNCLSVPVLP